MTASHPSRPWLLVILFAVGLSACGSQPPAPEWQMTAHGALQRYVQAYLAGQTRAADADFARARTELAATGRTELVARAELTRCAVQVASLDFAPCAGFELLRPDAAAAERAYANYLAAALQAADAAQLPAPHRALAGASGGQAALAAIADPVSRLVAAGVLMRSGRAGPEVATVAVDTAAAQGWRRPLLAWLGVQSRLAEQAGAIAEAERLRRRIALVQGER